MLKNILNTIQNHSKFELALDLIRIYLGIGLFLKGVHFMLSPQDLVYFMNQGKLDVLESFISHYVISAHLVGGLLLCIGLLTRLAATIQLPILIGALGMIHSKETLFSINQNIEFSALVLFLLVLFSIFGAGNISVDYHLLGESSDKKSWLERFICQGKS